MRVHGVDFSGSAEPGNDIWLVSGRCSTDGAPQRVDLQVTAARSASEAFGATERNAVLRGLRRFIRGADERTSDPQVTGLDCSFGLPRAVLPDAVAETDVWRATLEWVRETFSGADASEFQSALRARARASDADGVDLKRATDHATGASSPYSFITYYQTLHGLRDLLWNVVRQDDVVVSPMVSPPAREQPTLVETYPAATLRDLDLPDQTYKDDARHPGARERRERILDGLLDRGVVLDGVSRQQLLGDAGGDALDSLVCAVAVARNASTAFTVDDSRYDPVEGYIYV
ncbi:MAG: DUF429 domain-containing protein [Haloglomus sp.]